MSMTQLVATRTTGTATPPASMQSTSTPSLPAMLELGTDFGDTPFDRSEGSRCIKLFVEEIAPMFPFIVIPPATDAEQLYREKPLLYKCLTMITCQSDVSRQTDLAQMIGDDIGHCLSRGERSLPILQAILLYVAWYVHILALDRRHSILI